MLQFKTEKEEAFQYIEHGSTLNIMALAKIVNDVNRA